MNLVLILSLAVENEFKGVHMYCLLFKRSETEFCYCNAITIAIILCSLIMCSTISFNAQLVVFVLLLFVDCFFKILWRGHNLSLPAVGFEDIKTR